jgi:hypothetical protein
MSAEPPVLPDSGQARQWAAEELAKPEYREAQPSWLGKAWQDFLDWLASLGGPGDAGGAVPSPVIAIVVVLVVAVAIILARPRLNPAARRPGKDVFDADTATTADDFRRRADGSAAAGRWEEAVVDRFRALVRSAEDRTIIDPQPGRTADEVVRDLAVPFTTYAPQLAWAAAEFDAVRHGGKPARQEIYREMLRLDQELESAKPHRSPALPEPADLR